MVRFHRFSSGFGTVFECVLAYLRLIVVVRIVDSQEVESVVFSCWMNGSGCWNMGNDCLISLW